MTPEEREQAIAERLDALEWAMGNMDRIEDRLVKAYVAKLKRMIDEEEKRAGNTEGQDGPALLSASLVIS